MSARQGGVPAASPFGGAGNAQRPAHVEEAGNACLRAGLRRDLQDLVGRDTEDVFDLACDTIGLGGGKVDLVERGHDGEIVLERQVAVGQGLRFDALRRVDEQQGAFARGEAARHLVAEVDVARRVDEIQAGGRPMGGGGRSGP